MSQARTQLARQNILFIETGRWGGGSFASMFHHLKAMDRDRFEPHVIFFVENKYCEPLRELGIDVTILTDRIYPNPSKDALGKRLNRFRMHIMSKRQRLTIPALRLVHRSLISKICQICREKHIDLIHTNDSVYRDFFGLLAARSMKIPCVAHVRSTNKLYFNPQMAQFVNDNVGRVVAVSRDTADVWIEAGIDEQLMQVVFNGVEPCSAKPCNLHETFGISDQIEHIVGIVGPMESRKGHKFLLNAFGKIATARKDTCLLIVGDGPIRGEIENQIAELGISDQVVVTGYRADALEIIAALDILINSSKTEPLGRTILEAMQQRTPVIATETGGSAEIITSEAVGELVPFGDEALMASAVGSLLVDPARREAIAGAAKQRVDSTFSIRRHAEQLAEIYQELLN